MNSRLRRIRVLSDGRPGHENQSVGLALALARRTGAVHELVRIDPAAGLMRRMKAAAEGLGQIDLVIAAGHRTHLPLWWTARRAGARSVVIMRPSLPLALFDLALVPRHDLSASAKDTTRRILTRGALNRVQEESPVKENRGLVLVGGPSKHHGWDGAGLAPMIARVVLAHPELVWTVADSRRTPDRFLMGLELPASVVRVPHQQTGSGWLAGELARSRIVWVTEDSVSMVHEAVTARALTGVLPVPAAGKKPGRVSRAVTGLVDDGYATSFSEWLQTGRMKPGGDLNEAGRCADAIIARWYADHSRAG